MARLGMANLLTRLRSLVDDASATVWTDDTLQDRLDECRVELYEEPLISEPESADSDTIYLNYHTRWRNLEEATSGTTAWRVYDAQGTTIGTANYTADYIRGILTFTADQEGSARYIHARSYDLNRAAANLWLERAATKAEGYNFTADGASFSRGQWFDHCLKMSEYYEGRSRPMVVRIIRDDVTGS